MGILIGAKAKFKFLNNSEGSSSKENENDDKLTIVLLGSFAKFEPGLGRRDLSFLT